MAGNPFAKAGDKCPKCKKAKKDCKCPKSGAKKAPAKKR